MNTINPNLTSTEGLWGPMLQVSVQEVFERMLASTLTAGPESLVDEELDITAMVGIAGQLCGIITLRCPAQSAKLMAAKMLGMDAAQVGQEMWDAVGEICNMIAGNFKNKIAGMGDGCMLSVPTVIEGADYNLHPLSDSGKTEIHLLFEGMPLALAIQIHS